MKLRAIIALHARGEHARRDPNVWDRLKKLFGRSDDGAHDGLTTAHLVTGAKAALEKLGVTNAIALVVDGQVLFEDRDGRADDIGELFGSFSQSEAAKGRSLANVRLAVEHRDAGLHMFVEVVGLVGAVGPVGRVEADEAGDEVTAKVILSARIAELEVRAGEDARSYRARVGALLAGPSFVEAQRLAFETFATRLAEALVQALPDVVVSGEEPVLQVQRPARAVRATSPPARGGAADALGEGYDPYDRYIATPSGDVAVRVLWSAMMGWGRHPRYVVVDRSGVELGTTDDLADASGAGEDVDADADAGQAWAAESVGGGDW